MSDALKSTARFDEFATVDWIDDAAKERRRLQGLWSHFGIQRATLSWVYLAYDSAVSWLVVLLVGILIGVNTALISIVTEWLSDSKQGVCSTGWWLNQKFCCWEEATESCAAWKTWDHALVNGSSGFVRWLAFVALGTAMAALCAFLVRGYAPLAAGSGLGEIKAILGGFVISGFMALGTTAVTYTNVFTRADMGELLSYLLQECPSSSTGDGGWAGMCDQRNAGKIIVGLMVATVLRAIGTIVAYGCRVPCGIFVPSMAIGASFGRMLGTIAQQLHRTYPKWALFAQCAPDTPCITPATYAFLGAAAAMCGVTKVTVAVVVIMYELTGALNFIVPTMIVVMVARVIGDAIVEGGISEQLILLNGIPLLGEDEDECLLDMPVAAVMRPAEELLVLPAAGLSLRGLRRLLEGSAGVRGFPVVDSDMRLVGYVHRDAVAKAALSLAASDDAVVSFGASGGVSLGHLVNPSPTTVRPRTAAETVVEIFRKLGPQVILVASEEDGVLAGLLTRKDILRHTRSH
ncbi:glycerol ethanol, ferric requiring protein [Coemansia sp. RSA 2675]|nr:glycerol ethanol, ferric requiring protein [Coemansia sp. RSA 2675]